MAIVIKRILLSGLMLLVSACVYYPHPFYNGGYGGGSYYDGGHENYHGGHHGGGYRHGGGGYHQRGLKSNGTKSCDKDYRHSAFNKQVVYSDCGLTAQRYEN